MLGLFKKKLPHCDTLFEKFFSPWYNENDRPKMTRPDMYVISGFNGETLDLDAIQYLPNELLKDIKHLVNEMEKSALHDFQYINNAKSIDLNLLDAVDKYFDRTKITEIIKTSDPKKFSNDYLVKVCEFGAMIGHLFNKAEGYGWLYSYPYFHSIIVHKETGFGITVFDWAIKKFSEYGVDDGYKAKFQMALEAVKERN